MGKKYRVSFLLKPYVVEANSKEEATDIAYNYFEEYQPDIDIEEVVEDEEDDEE